MSCRKSRNRQRPNERAPSGRLSQGGNHMKLKEWAAFGLLGMIWGSSFLWIKIGVENITPFVLVMFRVSFGLLGLLVVMYFRRQSFPRDRATIMRFVFMGIFNTVVPFLLITWGETRIDSS